jgi:hypothetical protein
MKSISIILVISLCYSWLGCYVSKKETITENDELQNVLPEGDKLYLMKKDSTLYFFNAKTYTIVNDTLKGKGQRVIYNQKQSPEHFEISINDILKVEIDYIEEHPLMWRPSTETKIIILAIGSVVTAILIAIFLEPW